MLESQVNSTSTTPASNVIATAIVTHSEKLVKLNKTVKDFTGGHVKAATNGKYQVTLYFGFTSSNNPSSIQFSIRKEEASFWFESLMLFCDEFVKKKKGKDVETVVTDPLYSIDDLLDESKGLIPSPDNGEAEILLDEPEEKNDSQADDTNIQLVKEDVEIIPNFGQALLTGSNTSEDMRRYYEMLEEENESKLHEMEVLLDEKSS